MRTQRPPKKTNTEYTPKDLEGIVSQLSGEPQPKEIGSNRVKSGQKIGVNRCESVRILTDSGTKMRVNGCKRVQKIGTNRDRSGRKTRLKCDQMLPNATKNNPLTYQRLILLEVSFMCCVGQKLL